MNTRILIVGTLIIAGSVFLYLDSMHQPGNVGGVPIVGVTVPQLSGDAMKGELAFNENCSACHGVNAVGQKGLAPPLVHKIYEPSHHGDMSFVLAAKNGVVQHHWRFGNMPPVEGVSDKDIAMITTYVRTLQRANGIN